MSKKFIQNIQKLIEEKDPKKDLGLVSEGNISHFQAKPPALVSDPTPVPDPFEGLPGGGGPPAPKNKNFTWNKESFNHNRGAFKDLIFEDFLTTIKKSKTTITSINGDLSDYIVGDNKNVKYTIQVNVSTPVTVTITPFVNNSISLAVYTAPSFSVASKVFTSGSQRYSPSNINLNLNQIGLWTITILLYQEKGDTAFNILDQLGSFVEAASESITINDQKLITFDTTQGNNGIESIFIDGAFGPSLSNVIYWNKLDNFTEDFGGGELAGYGLYTIVNERLSFDVVSGWGTDAFAVTGSKLPLFPIAGTIGIPGPIAVTYKISGTDFDTGANRTIVTVSGTAFSGAVSDPIYIERTLHLANILQDDTLGSVVSGTHFNVKVGDQYTYEVDTFNSAGNRGPRSSRISAVAGDITPPNQLTNFVASGTHKAIDLSWTNSSSSDVKGIHIWDTASPISGTDFPIQNILKGTTSFLPTRVSIKETTQGRISDDTSLTLHASTFDYAGNENLVSMPSATATPIIEIKTKKTGQRIETDSASNQLRFFDANDKLIIKIGEDVLGSVEGMITTDGVVYSTVNDLNINPFRGDLTADESNTIGGQQAIRGRLSFTTSAASTQDGDISAIHGSVTASIVPANNFDVYAVRGQVLNPQPASSTDEHVFAGYFEGAKVFIEKDMIVSGTLKAHGGLDLSTVIPTIEPIYIRGTGLNRNTNRLLRIGNTEIYATTAIGLRLTVIEKSDHSVVSDTQYNTFGDSSASNSLATALDGITQDRIGILTSADAWEGAVTGSLRDAFKRLGLYHASFPTGLRHPYCAIFEGSTDTNINIHKAVEVIIDDDADSPFAEITGWLMDTGFSVTPPTALSYLTDASGDNLALSIDASAQVHIGSHIPNSKLSVDGVISGTGLLTSTGPSIFNEAGANVNFRIESDVDTDSFFVQGSQGNIGIGTSTFDGTAFGAIAIANGTAPGAGTANQSYIYAKDVSSSSEMHVLDEAGNETQISPHNSKGEWEFYSKNKKTGKVLKVNMEKLVKFIDQKFGTDFVEEFYENT